MDVIPKEKRTGLSKTAFFNRINFLEISTEILLG